MCNPEFAMSSHMEFVLSEHPSIWISVSRNQSSDRMREVNSGINKPLTTGGTGFVLIGRPISQWPRHAYILDLPISRDNFALRFFMNAAELKQLTEGYSPPWKSFAIDDPKDEISSRELRCATAQACSCKV